MAGVYVLLYYYIKQQALSEGLITSIIPKCWEAWPMFEISAVSIMWHKIKILSFLLATESQVVLILL